MTIHEIVWTQHDGRNAGMIQAQEFEEEIRARQKAQQLDLFANVTLLHTPWQSSDLHAEMNRLTTRCAEFQIDLKREDFQVTDGQLIIQDMPADQWVEAMTTE